MLGVMLGTLILAGVCTAETLAAQWKNAYYILRMDNDEGLQYATRLYAARGLLESSELRKLMQKRWPAME